MGEEFQKSRNEDEDEDWLKNRSQRVSMLKREGGVRYCMLIFAKKSANTARNAAANPGKV